MFDGDAANVVEDGRQLVTLRCFQYRQLVVRLTCTLKFLSQITYASIQRHNGQDMIDITTKQALKCNH